MICSTQAEIVSFWINIFILLISYLFFLLWAWQVHKVYPKYRLGHLMYFTEFFRGVKNKPQCLIYPIIFLSLRALSWLLVIVFAWINMMIKIIILSVMHSAVAIYLLITKPYEEVKNSIYESMSQVVMAVFCTIWIYYNTEDRWNPTINWVCIGIIVITSFINWIISIIEFIKAIKLKIQLCLRKRKTIEIKEKKITPKDHKRNKHKVEENKVEENKVEEHKIEEHKNEENKAENNLQDGIFRPYSKIQLKNNRELFIQEAEFSFANEELK